MNRVASVDGIQEIIPQQDDRNDAFSIQMSAINKPAIARESTCLAKSIALGSSPIFATPTRTKPPVVDPIVWGRQRMAPFRSWIPQSEITLIESSPIHLL